MTTYRFDKGFLIHGDCLKVLRRVPDESVDLVFADPPFNIDYKYDEYQDKLTPEEYMNWTVRWIATCTLKLKKTGSMFVAIGDEYAAEMKRAMDMTGLHMRNWIIWHYTFGVYCQTKFGRNHAHILYYCRDPKRRTFNARDVAIPSARQLRYQDKRADPKGRVPGDVWEYARVCGTFKERNKDGHKCQMPEELLERAIKATTQEKEIVLDPFGGTGTTAAVAAKLNRRFITVELSKAYCDGIRRRLQKRAKLL